MSITVSPRNDPPVASPNSAILAEDSFAMVGLPATDLDGDPLTYSVVTPPAHGALSGSGNSRTYTPDANYNGPDSFTFKANDGTADSNVATVSLIVTRSTTRRSRSTTQRALPRTLSSTSTCEATTPTSTATR